MKSVIQETCNVSRCTVHCSLLYVKHIITVFRLWVLQMLASNPPFTRKTESKLNTLTLVERMWSLIWYSDSLTLPNIVYVTYCLSPPFDAV